MFRTSSFTTKWNVKVSQKQYSTVLTGSACARRGALLVEWSVITGTLPKIEYAPLLYILIGLGALEYVVQSSPLPGNLVVQFHS
jgi:hypothetical protein